MADSYSQCTVSPYFPGAVITDERSEQLEAAGFGWETVHNAPAMAYLYSEDGPRDYDYEDKHTNWPELLQEMAVEAGIDAVIVEGAYYCSKMRQGEFGGYVTYITKDKIEHGGTQSLLELMASPAWQVLKTLEA